MAIFRVERDGDVALLVFDTPDSTVNTLSRAARAEFQALVPQLASDATVAAVVLISGKGENFIAGADIEEFAGLATAAEAAALSRSGQEFLQWIEDFPKPFVVAIHGACLGGGCETALAATWRIATDHPKTVIGLPETLLGVLPGAGGSVRLPRLIGLRAALDIILAGKSERAAKALKLGLIDEFVHPAILRQTAIASARRLVARPATRDPRPAGLLAAILDRTKFGRGIVARMARKQVLRKTLGNYPAQPRAIDVVMTGLNEGAAAGFAAEHTAFGELAVTDVSRKLVGLFFADTALKKDDPANGAKAIPVRRLGVLGAGFMGASIAGTAVTQAEVEARMKDADLKAVGRGIKSATGIVDGRLARKRITRGEADRLRALISGSDRYVGFRECELIIEAVFEDLDVKRQVLKEVEGATGPRTIFATNTSTIPISQIGANATRPGQVIGMHFFSPVDKMPLLEVIPTDRSTPETIATAVAFGRRMGKKVVVCKDHPGFWVNRILTPYLNEAGRLLSEGTPVDQLDRVLLRTGFPVGPAALLDEVGLVVAQKAGKVMHGAFGARLEPAPLLATLLADNRLGKKNARGFYHYHDGHKTGVDDSVYDLLGVRPRPRDPKEIEERCLYAMLNEAAMAYAEGVVRSPRDGDMASIYGIGFPPFRGGPLRMIDDLGQANVVQTLERLAAKHGPRFAPAPALVQMARDGRRYY
jgi:3-hydroxyacyl-CoA dehydrogenase / enoyl-CoA hydratase / 3-hydroxybutyryl-CoA epimerase